MSLRSMAANGPLVGRLDEITDRQWSMIEMLVADHDALVAAKAKQSLETTSQPTVVEGRTA